MLSPKDSCQCLRNWIRSKEMKVGVSVDYSSRSKNMKGWRMRDGSYVAEWGEVLLFFFFFYIWKSFMCYEIWREERDWFYS